MKRAPITLTRSAKQQLALLRKVKARMVAKIATDPHPSHGICYAVHYSAANTRSEQAARDKIIDHITASLGTSAYLHTWLLRKGIIASWEYNSMLRGSSPMRKKLLRTRIAWVDHMISCLETTGKLG